MNKSDKPSHQSIDSRETTRAQQTKLNIYLSLNIYLQDAEHTWIHRYWKSTFLSYTESPRLFQIYEGTSHIGKMCIIWRDTMDTLTWNSLYWCNEVQGKKKKKKRKKQVAAFCFLSCYTMRMKGLSK